MDFYLGMIIQWAINFEPEGFMLCDGRTLHISHYQALYSLLGNRYGGDGKTNFCIPDLRSADTWSTAGDENPRPKINYYICTMGLYPTRR